MTNVALNTLIWKEGKLYVSYVPQLEVASCGKTIAQAKKNIKEALWLFLEEAEAMGTLRDILEEAGLTRRRQAWQAAERVSVSKVRVAV